MNAIRLKTEYLKHPIGMDIVKPQLFWNCVEGGCCRPRTGLSAGTNTKTCCGIPAGWKAPPYRQSMQVC